MQVPPRYLPLLRERSYINHVSQIEHQRRALTFLEAHQPVAEAQMVSRLLLSTLLGILKRLMPFKFRGLQKTSERSLRPTNKRHRAYVRNMIKSSKSELTREPTMVQVSNLISSRRLYP